MATTKTRWADVEDNDDAPFDLPLPLPVIEGPDENGFKRTIEYKLDDAGRKVKVTAITRIRKLASNRISKRALERRSWAKFGDAVNDDPSTRLTVVSTEEIFLVRPRAAEVVSPIIIGGPLEATAGLALMLCRVCKKRGDHWTARCPYRCLTLSEEESTKAVVEQPPAKLGKCVPLKARPGSNPEQEKRSEEYSVRVNNLSEDVSNDDHYELFGSFEQVSRANVVFDKRTGASRGFGFVDFHRKEDAEKAVQRLNRFGGIFWEFFDAGEEDEQSASGTDGEDATDSDLAVVAAGFRMLRVLRLQNCKGQNFDLPVSPISRVFPKLSVSMAAGRCSSHRDRKIDLKSSKYKPNHLDRDRYREDTRARGVDLRDHLSNRRRDHPPRDSLNGYLNGSGSDRGRRVVEREPGELYSSSESPGSRDDMGQKSEDATLSSPSKKRKVSPVSRVKDEKMKSSLVRALPPLPPNGRIALCSVEQRAPALLKVSGMELWNVDREPGEMDAEDGENAPTRYMSVSRWPDQHFAPAGSRFASIVGGGDQTLYLFSGPYLVGSTSPPCREWC